MEIAQQASEILKRIENARTRRGGERPVTLVAVSKRQPTESIQSYIDFCASHSYKATLGENYLQEYEEKQLELSGDFSVHMIGALQRNKAKKAVSLFDVIEGVHSVKLAHELNKEASQVGKLQEVFFQFNISNDTDKSGFAPSDLEHLFLHELDSFESLKITGLMTITELFSEPELARPDFQAMHQIRNKLEDRLGRELLVSMGMSADFEIAIAEGADIVRVGSALFGERYRNI
ncbi:MAG: YggS family pyridoxal phosphate-dependent enzyme [Bdellovibrionales bacterium]|nr:YggS family pyridoxal phosphate-dependent enzyme [Bdellovibrionales bacterium]